MTPQTSLDCNSLVVVQRYFNYYFTAALFYETIENIETNLSDDYKIKDKAILDKLSTSPTQGCLSISNPFAPFPRCSFLFLLSFFLFLFFSSSFPPLIAFSLVRTSLLDYRKSCMIKMTISECLRRKSSKNGLARLIFSEKILFSSCRNHCKQANLFYHPLRCICNWKVIVV